MVANLRVTKMLGTLVNVARLRVTRMGGTVAGSATLRVTRMRATTQSLAGLRVTRMGAQVSGSASGPIVSVGAAQTVSSGELVTLTASASAAPGATIVAYTWRLVGVSATQTPKLSATNVQSPTFNAPPGMHQYTATFGVKVTDSVGRISAEATVVITVNKCDLIFATAGGWKQPGTLSYATAKGWS